MAKDTIIGGVSYNTDYNAKLTEKEFQEQHPDLKPADAKKVQADIKAAAKEAAAKEADSTDAVPPVE